MGIATSGAEPSEPDPAETAAMNPLQPELVAATNAQAISRKENALTTDQEPPRTNAKNDSRWATDPSEAASTALDPAISWPPAGIPTPPAGPTTKDSKAFTASQKNISRSATDRSGTATAALDPTFRPPLFAEGSQTKTSIWGPWWSAEDFSNRPPEYLDHEVLDPSPNPRTPDKTFCRFGSPSTNPVTWPDLSVWAKSLPSGIPHSSPTQQTPQVRNKRSAQEADLVATKKSKKPRSGRVPPYPAAPATSTKTSPPMKSKWWPWWSVENFSFREPDYLDHEILDPSPTLTPDVVSTGLI